MNFLSEKNRKWNAQMQFYYEQKNKIFFRENRAFSLQNDTVVYTFVLAGRMSDSQ